MYELGFRGQLATRSGRALLLGDGSLSSGVGSWQTVSLNVVKCIRGETTTKSTCTGGDGGWGKCTHESQHAGKGVHLECNHFDVGWKFYGIFISIGC